MQCKASITLTHLSFLFLAALPAHAVEIDNLESSVVSTISEDELSQTPVRNISDLIRLLPKTEANVHIYYQDATALTPGGNGSPVNGYDAGVIGVGAGYSFRPNVDSGFFIRGTGGYGVGSEKVEVSGILNFTDKVSVRAVYGSSAAGVIMPITRSTAVYGQGGAFYSSTKGTFDVRSFSGPIEFDGGAFNVFGLEAAVGVRFGLGGKNSLFMEQYSQYGWGSGEQDGSKYTSTVKYGCFRGGMNIGL